MSQAEKEGAGRDGAELVEAAIDGNIRLVCRSLSTESEVIKELVDAGKVKIVGAKYDLEDGRVTLLKGK